MIHTVSIRNFRRFRKLDLRLEPGINVIVGQNDAGKSTLVEAINLAMTGRYDGRPLLQSLTPYTINAAATKEYRDALLAGKKPTPPEVVVEVRFSDNDELAELAGTNNMTGVDAPGVVVKASFNPDFEAEYTAFVANPQGIDLVPTEYYQVEWLSFAGSGISRRSIPASAALIDASNLGWRPGADMHLQRALEGSLEAKERAELAREYRSVREAFRSKTPVQKINAKLSETAKPLTKKVVQLGIDISQRHTWESGLTLHLDDLPLAGLGTGERHALKTLMALGQSDAGLVLLEEPETNLSFSNLRRLLARIREQCEGRQVVVTTHSSFVLNKLGLEHMVLLEGDNHGRLTDLAKDTVHYFRRLPGYDTLRLVLADRAILVEGPSDELVVQRAYRDLTKKDAIEDGIDVISVGLSHKRFLDLARVIGREVRVVRDSDGKTKAEIEATFKEYAGAKISIYTGGDATAKTLEPEIAAANTLDDLNAVLGTGFATKDMAIEHMTANKTAVAEKIFDADKPIQMPEYIRNAVTWT